MEPLTDVAAYISPKRAAAVLAQVTAGAGQDNAEQTGIIIDRQALNFPKSVALCFPFITTLAGAATLKFKNVKLEDSDAGDMAGLAVYTQIEAAGGSVIATGGAGGTTETGVKKYGVNLLAAKRYVRLKYTPDPSAAGVDTADIAGCPAVFAGSYLQPAV